MRIGPDTTVTGPGRIEVWGSLDVEGAPGAPAELSVPVLLLGNGSSSFTQARLWGLNTTALELRAGSAILQDVLFEGNSRAILVGGSARLIARDTVFRDHAGEALYVEERADVELTRTTFTGNARGVTVYSAVRFFANDSSFVANGQHIVVDLGPWSAPGDITLQRDRFGAPSPTPAQLPGILLRHDPPLVDESAQRLVVMDSNRIEDASVAIRAEGRGLVVQSTNDTIVENIVGWSVQLATVRVERGTFGNDRDVEGSGRVTLDTITYVRDGEPAPAPASPRAVWLPWAIGATVLVLAAGAFLLPRLARSPPAPAPASLEPSALSEPAPAFDLGTAISVIERRILEDILAHPGTAQRAVADRLGTTRQALHYHVKKLEGRGLVLKSVDGRETRCTVPPAVASILAAAPATQTESQEKG